MTKSWKYDRAADHIAKKLKDVESVTVLGSGPIKLLARCAEG
jgi:hypothetical protein